MWFSLFAESRESQITEQNRKLEEDLTKYERLTFALSFLTINAHIMLSSFAFALSVSYVCSCCAWRAFAHVRVHLRVCVPLRCRLACACTWVCSNVMDACLNRVLQSHFFACSFLLFTFVFFLNTSYVFPLALVLFSYNFFFFGCIAQNARGGHGPHSAGDRWLA